MLEAWRGTRRLRGQAGRSRITFEQLALFNVGGMPKDLPEKSAYRVDITEVPGRNIAERFGIHPEVEIGDLLNHQVRPLNIPVHLTKGDNPKASLMSMLTDQQINAPEVVEVRGGTRSGEDIGSRSLAIAAKGREPIDTPSVDE